MDTKITTNENDQFENIKAQIYGAFSTCSHADVNFALEILELTLKQPEKIQSKLIQYACELWGTVRSSKEIEVPEKISKVYYDKMKSLYGGMVDETLMAYTQKGISEGWNREQFYEHLWKFIVTNIMWEKKEEKAFALYYIAIDSKTPYYNVGAGLKMNSDDYSRIQDEIFDAFREFRYIIALDFSQKTEEASLVLRLINRMETDEQKVVLVSRILSYYNGRIDKLLDEIRKG